MAYKKQRLEIVVPYGNITKLAKSFGIRRETVSFALRFCSSSQLAENIRERAIKEYGGKMQTITRNLLE